MTGSTISGNSAGAGGDGSVSDTETVGGAGGQGGSGGGIANAGTLVITNSTISGNALAPVVAAGWEFRAAPMGSTAPAEGSTTSAVRR